MHTLKIGVIGLGFIGAQHIDALRRVPAVEVAAVCDFNAANLEAARARFGVSKAYADWRELIADPGIDAVHNCTPNALPRQDQPCRAPCRQARLLRKAALRKRRGRARRLAAGRGEGPGARA